MASFSFPDFGHVLDHKPGSSFNELVSVDRRGVLPRTQGRPERSGELIVRLNEGGSRNCHSVVANCHIDALSVGVVAVPTVADAGGVASLSGESPALCTICDHRLDDAAIRSCAQRDCPHVQKDAA